MTPATSTAACRSWRPASTGSIPPAASGARSLQVAAARLKLADDTRMVLKNGLKLIGVDAPEKM